MFWELCILLDDYWERMNLKVPIYFSAGLTIQANMYYKMLIGWTSQKIKEAYGTRNTFDFKHVRSFDRSLVNEPGPCVLFATPGMITGGFSLEVFKQWAPSEKNLVTLPGYCVAGTVGHKLMAGKPTRIDLDKDTCIEVRCQIHQLSFSPHTDAKGIMDLIGFLFPRHVILVHGEKPKMATLKEKIQSELGIPCFVPANNESVSIPSRQTVKVDVTKAFLRNSFNVNINRSKLGQPCISDSAIRHVDIPEFVRDERTAEGVLLMEKNKIPKFVSEDDLLHTLGAKEHMIQLAYCCPVKVKNSLQSLDCIGEIDPSAQKFNSESSTIGTLEIKDALTSTGCSLLELLLSELMSCIDCSSIRGTFDHLELESFQARICSNKLCPYRTMQKEGDCRPQIFFCCNWSSTDDMLARKVLCIMREVELDATKNRLSGSKDS